MFVQFHYHGPGRYLKYIQLVNYFRAMNIQDNFFDMPLFRHARRFIHDVIPIFGHYATRAAAAISRAVPRATKHVEHVLHKSLTWMASHAVNFNPTFGVSEHTPTTSARIPQHASIIFPWETHKYPSHQRHVRTATQRAYDIAMQQKRNRPRDDPLNVFSSDKRRY